MQKQHGAAQKKNRLNKAATAYDQGKYKRARELCEKLLKVPATALKAHLLVSKSYFAEEKDQQALDHLKVVLQALPNNASLNELAGDIAYKLEDFSLAMSYFQRAFELDPDNAQYGLKLLDSMIEAGAEKQAFQLAEIMHSKFEHDVDITLRFSSLGAKLEKHESVIPVLVKSIEAQPESLDLHKKLLAVYTEVKEYEKQLEHISKYVSLIGDDPIIRSRVGVAHMEIGDLETAERCLLEVHEEYPDEFSVLSSLGRLYIRWGRQDESIVWNDKALAINPDHIGVRWNRALCYFSIGQIEKAYPDLDTRYEVESRNRQRPDLNDVPVWHGEDIHDKRLLIWSEQGIGDVFKFAALVGEAQSLCPQIIYEAQPKTHDFLRQHFPNIEVRDLYSPLGKMLPQLRIKNNDYDVHCSLYDLQAVLRPTMDSFKGKARIFPPVPELVSKIREYDIFQNSRPKVGLFWRSLKYTNDFFTAFTPTPEDLLPLLRVPDVDFISVQYDTTKKEVDALNERLGINIHHFEDIDLFDDMQSSLALMSLLDYAITSNSTIANMIGISGIKTFRYGPPTSPIAYAQDYIPWFHDQEYWRVPYGTPTQEITERSRDWLVRQLEAR